jgi:hypothetical protein
MEGMPSLIGWIVANLVLPYTFPLLLIKGIQRLNLDLQSHQLERMRLTYLLREGQLSLVSVAVSAASFCDIVGAEAIHSWRGKALIALLGLLFFSNGLLFVLGTVVGTPPAVSTNITEATTYRDWLKIYKMGAASLYLAFAVCVCAVWGRVELDPELRALLPVWNEAAQNPASTHPTGSR